jgi:hypothetical protein
MRKMAQSQSLKLPVFLLFIVLALLSVSAALDHDGGQPQAVLGKHNASMEVNEDPSLPQEEMGFLEVPEGYVCADREMRDCFPKIFEPTHEFQIVRDEQDLPKGLHVRLNLETGKKEAKIYVPDASDEAAAVVAVGEAYDTPEKELAGDTSDWYSSQAFEAVPPPTLEESQAFETHRQTLFEKNPTEEKLMEALEALEELSHSREVGVVIAKDSPLLNKLIDILYDAAKPETRQRAVMVIGGALYNNPTAWNATRSIVTTMDQGKWPLVTLLTSRLPDEDSLRVKASIVSALRQVISQSRSARTYFINEQHGYVSLGACLSGYMQPDYQDLERISPSYEEIEEEPVKATTVNTELTFPTPKPRRERRTDYVPAETSHTPEQRVMIADLDNLAAKVAILSRDLMALNRQFAPVPSGETDAEKLRRIEKEVEQRDANVETIGEWFTIWQVVLNKSRGDPVSEAMYTLREVSEELGYCKDHYRQCWPGDDN